MSRVKRRRVASRTPLDPLGSTKITDYFKPVSDEKGSLSDSSSDDCDSLWLSLTDQVEEPYRATRIGDPFSGHDEGQFFWPEAVVVTHDGQVVVADTDNNRLQVFDAQLQFVRVIGDMGDHEGGLCAPSALCCGYGDQRDTKSGIPMHDILIVADSNNKRVQVVSVLGDWIHAIPCPDDRPCGVCVDSLNNIYASLKECLIVVFSWTGELLRMFGPYGDQPGQLVHPNHICFDFRHEQLVVADRGNDRVQVFSSSGETIKTFGWKCVKPYYRPLIFGVCVVDRWPISYIVASDDDNSRLHVYSWNGKRERLVSTLGNDGYTRPQFKDPRGLCVDSHGRLYVAESEISSVQVIHPATAAREAFLACCMTERFQLKEPITELAE